MSKMVLNGSFVKADHIICGEQETLGSPKEPGEQRGGRWRVGSGWGRGATSQSILEPDGSLDDVSFVETYEITRGYCFRARRFVRTLHIGIQTQTNNHTNAHTHTYTHTQSFVSQRHTDTDTETFSHTYTHTHRHTHRHIDPQRHIYTYTHTDKYTQSFISQRNTDIDTDT